MNDYGRALLCAGVLIIGAACQGGATIGSSPAVHSATLAPGQSPAPLSSGGGTSSAVPSASAAPTATATPTAVSTSQAVVPIAAGCPQPVAAGVTGPPPGSGANSPVGKIKHIVNVIQENRTFDNIFHGFSEPSGVKSDYTEYGCNKAGKQIALTSVAFESQFSPPNAHNDFVADFDGGAMDGFYDHNGATATDASEGNNGLCYLPQAEVQPYFDMATSGALAERFFHGITGPTYVSHLMFQAASTTYDNSPAHRVIGNASGSCSAPTTSTVSVLDTDNPSAKGVIPCYTGVQTITDLLDTAGHTWHYYSEPVNIPSSVSPLGDANVGYGMNGVPSYSQDFAKANFAGNDITPSETFLTDVASGTLEDVTWVTPDQVDSDHPAESTAEGPAWVESVVDAVGESSYYANTAIFVTWDDDGGLYDHVPPPQKYAPYGLAMRIPLIAISPFARQGQLIDTQLEPGSIVRFIEEVFGLPSLGREDMTSNSVDDMFDFSKPPAPFTPIASARYGRDHFLHHLRHSYLPVDNDVQGPDH